MSVVTPAQVKALGRISTDSQDTLLQEMIDSAESFVEEYCDISLTAEEVTESLDGDGFYINPARKPLTAITSVTADGTLLDAADYKFEAFGIFQADETRWYPGKQRYVTVYTGGHATPPAGLLQAIKEIVLRAYMNFEAKESDGDSGKSTGWQSLWRGNDITAKLEQYSMKTILS